VTASLAGFYTRRRDLVVEDPSRTAADELPFSSGGSGRSVGFETLVKAQRGRWFAWLAYTFSRSTRRDDPGAAGRPFAYDQTHLVSAVGSYERGPWRFGARWQLATGLPYTPITSVAYSDELHHFVPSFGAPYAARFETSHQLDLRAERTFQRKGYRLAVFADLGNVYRRERVLRYQYSDDFMSKKPVADLLPLPSIGLRGEL
jgi:outer membrane receptor protein involved in Fe transport